VSLLEQLTQPPQREHIVTECCELIDAEVQSKGGLSGIAVKGAYKLVKTVKSGFVREVVDAMLDEWVGKLDPFYQAWLGEAAGRSLPDYMASRGEEIAERLLEVTDGRAKNAKNGAVRKMYDKLRPAAKRHVEAALPRLGRLLERNVA